MHFLGPGEEVRGGTGAAARREIEGAGAVVVGQIDVLVGLGVMQDIDRDRRRLI